MSSYTLTFWQNILSPHQSAALRALAAAGHVVRLVVDQEELPERRAMGWARPDFGKTEIVVAPTPAQIEELAAQGTGERACHLISGLRSAQLSAAALPACIARGAKLGLVGEPGDPRGAKGLLRRVLHAREALAMRRSVDFVLGMGQTGVDWYTGVGYPRARVLPYAYVVETPPSPPAPAAHDTVRLAFAGALIPRKGVDLLLRALARLTALPWTLDLIGDGPEREMLTALATQGGIADRVRFLGKLPMAEVGARMAEADLFILPSRFDGWGAVVNEALMAGVPVLCSSRCGAGDLLREGWRGATFTSEYVASLAEGLGKRIHAGPLPIEDRVRLRAWTRCITGEAVAAYLVAVLDHVYFGAEQPVPPWR